MWKYLNGPYPPKKKDKGAEKLLNWRIIRVSIYSNEKLLDWSYPLKFNY